MGVSEFSEFAICHDSHILILLFIVMYISFSFTIHMTSYRFSVFSIMFFFL